MPGLSRAFSPCVCRQLMIMSMCYYVDIYIFCRTESKQLSTALSLRLLLQALFLLPFIHQFVIMCYICCLPSTSWNRSWESTKIGTRMSHQSLPASASASCSFDSLTAGRGSDRICSRRQLKKLPTQNTITHEEHVKH